MLFSFCLTINNIMNIFNLIYYRLGLPEEIARTALFLADDNSGFITGLVLSINGGQHML